MEGGGGGRGAGVTQLYELRSIMLLISYIGMCCPIGCRVGSGRVHFAHFGLESRMVFEGTTRVYESIYRFNSKKKEKEKSANSK